MTDFADEEVRGLERYFPTTLSKWLIAAIPSPFLTVFPFIRANSEWFLANNYSKFEQTAIAFLVSLSLSLLVSLGLIIELLVVIRNNKHRYISHYSNIHPYMSALWLFENATWKHYLLLSILACGMFILGFYSGRFLPINI